MRYHWKRTALIALGVAISAVLLVAALGRSGQTDIEPEQVSFSAESGFYDAPFYLELYGHGGDVYYTLDSSDPDENSLLYTEPLLIQDASPNDNVYSMIQDVALDLNPEYLTDNGAEPRFLYKLPQKPVDKATVVRAVCIDALGNRSEIVSGVYFVGYLEKSGYDGIKIVSVTMDPKNLFDAEKGIYVLGKRFQDILKDGRIVVPQAENYLFWEANYRQKGDDWEREASVCIFDSDGSLIVSSDYGIRVQGRGSRARLPKSLNLIGRKRYGSEAFDGQRLFGAPYQLTTLNLNTGANDIDSMLRDYIVNQLAADMNVGAREYVPCALFLDGEYWGLYWMTPRHKEDYLSQRYGVKPSNIVEIKEESVEIGRDDDVELYNDMVTYISDNDMSLPENYARACELIDIDSCLDYYALQMYIANADWPPVNCALWRTRVADTGEYSDCKWRWLVYDVNLAMVKSWSGKKLLQRTINRDPMFASLMDNPDFSAALYARMVRLATDVFEPEKVEAFIEDYKALMAGPMEKKFKRFYGEKQTLKRFNSRCASVNLFYQERHDYIIQQYGGMVQ